LIQGSPRGTRSKTPPSERTVILSVNSVGNTRCVDVFARADATFGFEEYRRDCEDARGWFPVGGFSLLVFSTKDKALAEAWARIEWFNPAAP
jgi:hypothetical protein